MSDPSVTTLTMAKKKTNGSTTTAEEIEELRDEVIELKIDMRNVKKAIGVLRKRLIAVEQRGGHDGGNDGGQEEG